jgi:hypothetical protein
VPDFGADGLAAFSGRCALVVELTEKHAAVSRVLLVQTSGRAVTSFNDSKDSRFSWFFLAARAAICGLSIWRSTKNRDREDHPGSHEFARDRLTFRVHEIPNRLAFTL